MSEAFVKKLSSEAKNLWFNAYEKAISKGYSKAQAFNIASSAIQKLHLSVVNGRETKVRMRKAVLKSLVSEKPIFSFEGVLTSTEKDSGHEYNQVSESLLHKMTEQAGFIEPYGTIDHCEYIDEKDNVLVNFEQGEEPYFLEGLSQEGRDIKIKYTLNPKYPHFDLLLQQHKEGKYLCLSAEFKDAITYNNMIIVANKIGWTVTNEPKHQKAKVTNIARK